MTRVQAVSKSGDAVLRLLAGFLVIMLLQVDEIHSQTQMLDVGGGRLRRCVVDEFKAKKALASQYKGPQESAERLYDQLDLYTEKAPIHNVSVQNREQDISVLYWDLRRNRSCLKPGEQNENVETFIDFNLQKILSGAAGPNGVPTPDILVLDNCQSSCTTLPGLFSLTLNELQSVYSGGGSKFNCEFIKKNVENSTLGTCLFWSKKLRSVPTIGAMGEPRNDRVVDWVPLNDAGKHNYREKYRKHWAPKLFVKLSSHTDIGYASHLVSSNMLANFSPRVFENDFGKRIHIIPAHVNRYLGNRWRNVKSDGWNLQDWIERKLQDAPYESDPESIVHNQVERYASELNMYLQDVASARESYRRAKDSAKEPQKDDIFLMVGNFEIPSRTCQRMSDLVATSSRALQSMTSLAEDVMAAKADPSLCNWPTSAVLGTNGVLKLDDLGAKVPKYRDDFRQADFVGLQTHHAYFRSFSEKKSFEVLPSILPVVGSESYPMSIRFLAIPDKK
ncbi:MAG: hypothetical protein K2X47_00335 [Bdellovibrionales bacterium]|nr:hypothetical protein [Bdellovibrionales bacterium]